MGFGFARISDHESVGMKENFGKLIFVWVFFGLLGVRWVIETCYYGFKACFHYA